MKYYAVRNGVIPGIYTTWPECEKQIKGFKGAEYKSFSTKEEAENYIDNSQPISTTNIQTAETSVNTDIRTYMQSIATDHAAAFTDGSFDKHTNHYSYGIILYDPKTDTFFETSDHGNDPEMASMRNVAGEIEGSMRAMLYCIDNHISELDLYYDYEGIAKWALGEWKTNKINTRRYADYYNSLKTKLKVNFMHVYGHTGITGNEYVDKLAKRELGIK